jgi:hypothetical protein
MNKFQVTPEFLEEQRLKINALIRGNIDSLPTNACVNRADFKCNCVKFFIDCYGEKGFDFLFDECSPGDEITSKWLDKLFKSNEFEHFNIIMEW